MLTRKVGAKGDSLVITIPSQLAQVYKIEAGDNLKIDPQADGLLICKRIPK